MQVTPGKGLNTWRRPIVKYGGQGQSYEVVWLREKLVIPSILTQVFRP